MCRMDDLDDVMKNDNMCGYVGSASDYLSLVSWTASVDAHHIMQSEICFWTLELRTETSRQKPHLCVPSA